MHPPFSLQARASATCPGPTFASCPRAPLNRVSRQAHSRPLGSPFVGLQRTRPPGCLLCLNRTRVVGRDLSDGLAVKHLPDLQHAQPSAYAGSSSGAGFLSSSMSTRVFSL